MRATQDLSSVGNPFLSEVGGHPGVHHLRSKNGECLLETSPSALAANGLLSGQHRFLS